MEPTRRPGNWHDFHWLFDGHSRWMKFGILVMFVFILLMATNGLGL